MATIMIRLRALETKFCPRSEDILYEVQSPGGQDSEHLQNKVRADQKKHSNHVAVVTVVCLFRAQAMNVAQRNCCWSYLCMPIVSFHLLLHFYFYHKIKHSQCLFIRLVLFFSIDVVITLLLLTLRVIFMLHLAFLLYSYGIVLSYYPIFIRYLKCKVRSVNSKSFIFGSEFIFSSLRRTKSNPIMKLSLFTERTYNALTKNSKLIK